MMTFLNQARLLFVISRPLAWVIAPAIWFSGIIHSGANAKAVPGILFAAALSFPTCLSEKPL